MDFSSGFTKINHSLNDGSKKEEDIKNGRKRWYKCTRMTKSIEIMNSGKANHRSEDCELVQFMEIKPLNKNTNWITEC